MKLSIIIPVYNEEKTVKELISIVKKVDTKDVSKELVVVDDGSKDNTVNILKNITGIKLIIHKKNAGKGAAVRTGIKHSTGDIIIIQDADLEYNPNDYYKLIKPIIDKKTKVVYGSRYLSAEQKRSNWLIASNFLKAKHTKAYFTAYLGGRFLTFLANFLYRGNITDEPTCYKVFKADVLKSINLKCKRFEFCPEVTAKVLKKGYKIFEIPTPYKPRSFEEGKKINWKDGLEAIWTLIKYRFVD
jgi:glycosyltransferase involved in cell wall biosynthesis